MGARKKGSVTEIGPDPTNGGKEIIEMGAPYQATAVLRGSSDMLWHRYNCESVAAKSEAKKGSAAKKTDDVESYVYRDDKRRICIPSEYLHAAITNAAKFRQDPRSPRKSAMDLFKAGVVVLTPLSPILVDGKGVTKWDYEHVGPVNIQRSRVTRVRPAFKAGWEAEFEIMVILPQYIGPELLHEVISDTGKFIGLADRRPTYGRFQVTKFNVTG
jgi:hypothetical protein